MHVDMYLDVVGYTEYRSCYVSVGTHTYILLPIAVYIYVVLALHLAAPTRGLPVAVRQLLAEDCTRACLHRQSAPVSCLNSLVTIRERCVCFGVAS